MFGRNKRKDASGRSAAKKSAARSVRMGFVWLSSVFIITLGLYFWASRLQALSIPDSHHYVEFVAKGTPYFLRIIGRGEDNCTGIVNNHKGKISCHLKDIKTGISLRDKHMLKYLGAEKHPMVTLSFEAEGKSSVAQTFQGILELNGKRVLVTGRYVPDPLKLDFIVNINDFDIGTVKYLGVGIEPDINVSAGLR